MPVRKDPLVTGEIYHIVNRGVASMPIFLDDRYHHRFLEAVFYYRHQRPPIRYSYFSRLPQSVKSETLLKLDQLQKFFVEIICYCLMPNHFHFLLKQTTDNGISEFMRRFSESYTHYFNVKNKRIGPIFQGRFKSIRIKKKKNFLPPSLYFLFNLYRAGFVKFRKEYKGRCEIIFVFFRFLSI